MTFSPLDDQLTQPAVRRSWTAFSLNLVLMLVTLLWLAFALTALYDAREIHFFRNTPLIFWLMASSGTLLLLVTLVFEPLLKRIKAHGLAIILLALTLIAGTTWSSKVWVLHFISDRVAEMTSTQKSTVFGVNKLLANKSLPELAAIFGVKDQTVPDGELLALRSLQLASGVTTPLKARPLKWDRETERQVMGLIYSSGLTVALGSVLILLNALSLILLAGRLIATLLPQQERRVRLASLGITLIAGLGLYSSLMAQQSALTASAHYQTFATSLAQVQGEGEVRLATFAIHAQGHLLPLAERMEEQLNPR
ncbi:hypothetical protein [Candidatus Pantoea multigeneris]|uniref:Uncharacterized protein n=1 Tax=Candidatus Pantoea multigeneris TaxID=2608357 RepID=A0ABX0RCU8_9GAMM|nr:hypothetical protein [Pantoea multigeneris]NIF22136.1 hypothetical protein [Pantoea multigeneris]